MNSANKTLLARAGTILACSTLIIGVTSARAQDSAAAKHDTTLSQVADTTVQNPPGYRAMEGPVGSDSAMAQPGDTTAHKARAAKKAGKHKHGAAARKKSQQAVQDSVSQRAAGDSVSQDSSKWGYPTDTTPGAQNPPGYRGMERPVNVFPPDSAVADSAAPGNPTSRVNQMERQDSAGNGDQNPPGYRGMERPAGVDSAAQRGADSVQPSEPTGKAVADSAAAEAQQQPGSDSVTATPDSARGSSPDTESK